MDIKELESIKPDLYNHIDLDRLVMFTAVKLDDLGFELSLENIIVGAFILFPNKFSLFGYPEYPDATRVEKSLWRCKENNRRWIGGKTRHGYKVINRTRVIAEKIAKQLSVPISKQRKGRFNSSGRRKISIIRELENSSAYVKYKNNDIESINESDFCYLLQGTLDSSKETLRANLDAMKEIIQEVDKDDLKKFILDMENMFADYLRY